MSNNQQTRTLVHFCSVIICSLLILLLASCSNSLEAEVSPSATNFTPVPSTSTKQILSSIAPPTPTNTPITRAEISRIATFGRIDGDIMNIVISDNGKILAAAGGNNDQIIIWDINSGKVLLSLKDNNDWNFALSADGRLLASTIWGDHWITIRDIQTGQTIQKIRANRNTQGFAFSPDGNILAVDGGSAIWLWNIQDNTLIDYLGPESSSIGVIAFSPDGKELVSVSDFSAQLWDLSSRKAITTIRLAPRYHLFWGASISPRNPNYIAIPYLSSIDPKAASYLDKNTVQIWDIKKGKLIQTIEEFGSATTLAISPDGRFLAVTQTTNNQIWDISSGKTVYKFPSLWTVFAFSADGNRLAVGHMDGTIDLCDISQLK